MAGPCAQHPADALAASLRTEGERILAEVRGAAPLTFRGFLTGPDFAGLTLSPAIAAIVDASEGTSVAWAPPALVQALFACPAHALPSERRRVVAVSAGGRGGKTSRLLAPRAVYAAWSTPLRLPGAPVDPRWPLAQEIAKGERPVALILASKKKLARQAFRLALGIVEGSPVLKRALVGEATKTSFSLRRPDGIIVDIEIGVADAGGQNARSMTLVFCGLDEASFFRGEGYAVNDEDVFSAAIQRVVPYGQIWIVSTPWIEGEGLLERFIADEWGRHVNALVVARAGTRMLNPTWDPDGSIERTERARPGGAENANREILAIPLPKGTKAFFGPADIKAALALAPPVEAVADKGAGADFGHAAGRDNSGLAIGARYVSGYFAALRTREIKSTEDQKPSMTYKAFALDLAREEVDSCACDVHQKQSVKEEWDKHGVSFIDTASPERMYKGARDVFAERRLALGGLSEEERESLEDQLLSVVAKPKAAGGFTIGAPRRRVSELMGAAGVSGGGAGHADTVSALVAMLWRVGSCSPDLWRTALGERARLPDAGGEVRYAPGEDPLRGAAFDWAAERAGGSDGDGWESSGGGSQWG